MVLAHTHSPYAWQADVDTTVVIPALSLLYLFAVGRFGAPRWRIGAYAAGMVLLAIAFWTPLHHLGLHYLLTAHLLQNVILAEWVNPGHGLGYIIELARTHQKAPWSFAGLLVIGGIGLLTDFVIRLASSLLFRWRETA